MRIRGLWRKRRAKRLRKRARRARSLFIAEHNLPLKGWGKKAMMWLGFKFRRYGSVRRKSLANATGKGELPHCKAC